MLKSTKSFFFFPFCKINETSVCCIWTVHGKEYGFGAHDFPASGVFEVEPRNCPGFVFRCSISLGYINMSPSEFRAFIENVASEYHGDTYHLISKNCNHFTDDISSRLTGKQIPGWVNRLARLGIKNFHLFPSCFICVQLKILWWNECYIAAALLKKSTPLYSGFMH